MVIYTVKKDDTLYTIAERLGADIDRIILDNQLDETEDLVVGQSLVIRSPLSYHTVCEGENIYSIAEKYRVTIDQIWQNNVDIGGRTTLTVGQRIVINDVPKIYKNSVSTSAYVYPGVKRELLMSILPYLTYLTVFSYGIEEDGYLSEIDDEDIIALAKEYGTSPIMHISNIDYNGNYSPELVNSVLSENESQNIFIGNILRKVTEKRYSGVILDIEYIPRELSEKYAIFLEKLDEKLGSGGYKLWIALPPKSKDSYDDILREGYDYKIFGEVSDKVVLQTYGWCNTYSEAGAISPFDKVYDVCDYARKNIDTKKLFLGIPNYGYDWSTGDSALPLGNREAIKIAREKGGEVKYDASASSPHFEYYDAEGCLHSIYFEDVRSISALLSLINEFGFCGLSVWNAMKLDPELWVLINGSYRIEKVSR